MFARLDIIGRLGHDATARKTTSGQSMLAFNVAVDQDRPGSGQETPPMWVRVLLFGKLADALTPYLAKGKMVYASGRVNLEESEYQGEKRTRLILVPETIKLLGPKGQVGQTGETPKESLVGDTLDDEVPF